MDRAYKKIGLLDHMGYGNMGDAAIQESFIANIRRRMPNAVLVGFSLDPDDTRKRHDLGCYPIRRGYPGWNGSATPQAQADVSDRKSRLKPFLKKHRVLYALAKRVYDFIQELAHLRRSYSVVRSLDLLVMSGGGQLSELFGDLPYNVFKFCLLAKLSKTPVIIVGVGADLLERPLNKFFAKWSVRLANFSSFRSVESQNLIRKLGVKKETHVCPDPAYALDVRDYVTSKRSDTLTAGERQSPAVGIAGCALDLRDCATAKASNGRRLKVGLNPMGTTDPRRWTRKDNAAYSRYIDKIQAFSSWLLAQNYQLEIFSSDVLGDSYAVQDLKQRVLNGAFPDAPSEMVVRPLGTLEELLLQMSTFDVVITSKYHGVIFSHLLAKPVIALSYLAKIDDLMRTVGHDRYCLDIEDFDVKSLIESFKSLVDERDHLSALFRKTSATYADLLRMHFDNLFGRDAVTRVSSPVAVAECRNEIR